MKNMNHSNLFSLQNIITLLQYNKANAIHAFLFISIWNSDSGSVMLSNLRFGGSQYA